MRHRDCHASLCSAGVAHYTAARRRGEGAGALEDGRLDGSDGRVDRRQRGGRLLRRLLAEGKVQLLDLKRRMAQASGRSGVDNAQALPGCRRAAAAAPGTHVLDQLVNLGGAAALGRHQVVQVEAQRADLAAQLRARTSGSSAGAVERVRACSRGSWAACRVAVVASGRGGVCAGAHRARVRGGPRQRPAREGWPAVSLRTSFWACVQYFLLL